MTREEEIIQAARKAEKTTGFSQIVMDARGIINSAYGVGFLEGAEWADKTLLEKVCEYIASNMRCDGYTTQTKAKFIQSLKKAMIE